MRCPNCASPTLAEQPTQQNVIVDLCTRCHGVWLDRGVLYEFSERPQELEALLDQGLRERRNSDHLCPRCDAALEHGRLVGREAEVERCPRCGGLWFEADNLEKAVQAGPGSLELTPSEPATGGELVAEIDTQVQGRAHERLQDLRAGLLALPNLILRSLFTLGLLYSLLVLVLISLVLFAGVNETIVLIVGVAIALLQFLLGPWIMDLSLRWVYKFRWVSPQELPEHLEEFVERVCREEKMKFPTFGLIDDGAPTAFTYGHHPGNARLIISRGLLELLQPQELEAVVAHELGHAHNWDMALMTVAQLVPLLLFYIYYFGVRLGQGRGKGKEGAWAVALGAYVLYIVSEYIVLWFSRTREYFADRFAGRVTQNPNALALALVKIAYGLASQGKKEPAQDKKAKEEEAEAQPAGLGALRALNIFDDRAAVGLVMASSVGRRTDTHQPDVENIKSAMQWDLWNPWAKFYELNSTHPLVAHRLMYLTDQAAHLGQDPLVVFDRRKAESYWDDFLVDILVLVLPWVGLLVGLAVGLGLAVTTGHFAGLGAALILAGLGSLWKTQFVYRRDFFPHLSVAALMHRVKVSAVRPVPVTLTGKIIGKGVPGLIWSEDFVLQDQTGILFIDYRQPLALWNFLFGLLRAGGYQGKQVRVKGWFRRAPVPFLELFGIETLDGSEKPRRCYALFARLAAGVLLVAAGILVTAALFVK